MRLLLLAALVAAPLASIAPSASALCGPEQACPPCPITIELKPKPHIGSAQC